MEPKDRLRPYVADGIEEYDNPMPRWWVGLFYATIVFAVIYLVRYHILGSPSLEEVMSADAQAAHEAADAAAHNKIGSLSDRLSNPELVKAGKEVYATNCVPCHGAAGEGNIGPNLTDAFWLHGGRPEDIVHTITQGFVEKGMPPWGPVLGDAKVEQVAAYVLSLKGSAPPNGKPPQGERYDGAP